MHIGAPLVKELRERTGAGMMECKKALVEVQGDIEAAVELLRKSGQAKADKKSGRVTAQGLIGIATDAGKGAMVEVNCETDFVAREDKFKEFVQVVARRVLSACPDDVAALGEVSMEAGGGPSVEEQRRELIAQIGENVSIRRLALVSGEGGSLGAYSHGGRIGVLVDLRGGDANIGKDIAMHIAASRPLAIAEADISPGTVEHEREILRAQVADSGKPAEIQEKMVTGRLTKYLREVTLLGQRYVKDPDVSVDKYLRAAGAEVSSFVRFEVGEGIEKKT